MGALCPQLVHFVSLSSVWHMHAAGALLSATASHCQPVFTLHVLLHLSVLSGQARQGTATPLAQHMARGIPRGQAAHPLSGNGATPGFYPQAAPTPTAGDSTYYSSGLGDYGGGELQP